MQKMRLQARAERRARAAELEQEIRRERAELDREVAITRQMTESSTRYMTGQASRYLATIDDAVGRMR